MILALSWWTSVHLGRPLAGVSVWWFPTLRWLTVPSFCILFTCNPYLLGHAYAPSRLFVAQWFSAFLMWLFNTFNLIYYSSSCWGDPTNHKIMLLLYTCNFTSVMSHTVMQDIWPLQKGCSTPRRVTAGLLVRLLSVWTWKEDFLFSPYFGPVLGFLFCHPCSRNPSSPSPWGPLPDSTTCLSCLLKYLLSLGFHDTSKPRHLAFLLCLSRTW